MTKSASDAPWSPVSMLKSVVLPAFVYPTSAMVGIFLVTAFAKLSSTPPNDVEVAAERADAVADAASIGFELGFARASCADAAAKARQRSARADQPRHEGIELCELDLQFPFASAGAPRKNVQDQLRSVDHFPIELRFEVAKLGRRQLVVEDDDVGARLCASRRERIDLATSEKRGGSGLGRSWRTRSTTEAPAASARPASSSSA